MKELKATNTKTFLSAGFPKNPLKMHSNYYNEQSVPKNTGFD